VSTDPDFERRVEWLVSVRNVAPGQDREHQERGKGNFFCDRVRPLQSPHDYTEREACMKRTICCVIGTAMVSCLMFAGCQKTGEKAAEKAIENSLAKEGVKAKVDASGKKITIESKDGTTVYSGGKDAKVPENFPKDIYVYEGAAITAAITVPQGFNLAMETSDKADKVLATIKTKMTDSGWKEEMALNQENNSMVSYKKGERTTMVTITTDKQTTRINLTAQERKGS
jgi:hypothetical protein